MAIFSGTIWVSWHQKSKPFWILLKQETIRWQWHQLDHMEIICTSLKTDNHAITSPFSFYKPDALPAAQPTAWKHWRHRFMRKIAIKPDCLHVFHTCQYSAVLATATRRHCLNIKYHSVYAYNSNNTRHSNDLIFQRWFHSLEFLWLIIQLVYNNSSCGSPNNCHRIHLDKCMSHRAFLQSPRFW